ncbi:hypothetical protein [Roseomonas sp. HF4]|uniref:hypothetical protein n=1 Tax=Roseomonas sp. HF4 TaxID=2562313 RepID=UPI0010BF91A0|nr:hypothetical protein [Roseomonas sp. HF4]
MIALIVPGVALGQAATVVVPAGSAVVIGPRGQAQPRPSLAPATRTQRRAVMVSRSTGETLAGPTAAAAVGLAGAAAIAVLLGAGGGGGSGGSAAAAPSRTR